VRPGREAEPITYYTVLATIEAAYTLPRDVRAFTSGADHEYLAPVSADPVPIASAAGDIQETRTRDRDDRA